MLTSEQNALITQTGPGTPGGKLLRSYWQPVALSEELPPGGAPIPVRVLGEDLVLFRDEDGELGLLGLRCSHRGTDLSYGRVEDGGLRCLYHGWLYDRRGRCLEQPGEPAGSDFKDKIRHTAYPCREMGGAIFAYLGEGEPPVFPAYEFLRAPEANRWCTKFFTECNYLQGNEGNIDPQHLSFLHRNFKDTDWYSRRVQGSDTSSNDLFGRDVAPTIELEETEFGVRIYSIRRMDEGQNYVRISNFVMPNVSTFPGITEADGYQAHIHVPIDDTHHWKFEFNFRRSGPIDREWIQGAILQRMEKPYHLARNRFNRYLQDREEMRTQSFTGMGSFDFQSQDRFAVESQGAVQDRTAERLGTTDRAIIAARQQLLAAVHDVQEGRTPRHVVREGSFESVDREIVVKAEAAPSSVDWKTFWQEAIPTR
ncbi:MAG TPA: Rieske 2Fe-2S domain-containing protein [Chloroflexota bacterium]|nr:Rieske 2Fe-2S domain-containing protein [Chloroflexota bacterium]